MLLFDLAALSLALALARSGWRRGLVSMVTDLVGFTSAVVLAVRFHRAPATVASALGMSDGWAAVAGGVAIFAPLIALTALVGSKLGRVTAKPGLRMTDRTAGLAVATGWGAALATFVLLLAAAVPAPGWVLGPLERSPVAALLRSERSPLPALLTPWAERVAGDDRTDR